jgi:2-C-methyl-D-erythritol 4-phosphate cytidylyltransferase
MVVVAQLSGSRPVTAVVPLEGRGDLPFETVHGIPLLVHAFTALSGLAPVVGPVVVTCDPPQRSPVRRLVPSRAVADPAQFWSTPHSRVLLHDCLCPLVPRAFLEQMAAEPGPAAAYRPVTDTLKAVQDDRTVDTVDRDRFGIVTSPLLLVDVAGRPPTEDFAATVLWLRERAAVALVKAPSIGRRASDLGSLSVLESVDALTRSVREYPADMPAVGPVRTGRTAT